MHPKQVTDSTPTVFVVDNDQSTREALAWLLESLELRVEAFESIGG